METVLLEGRLHPAAIVIEGLTGLRRSGLYLALLVLQAVFAKEGGMVLFGVVAFAGLMGLILLVIPGLRYLRFRYRLTTESLYITSGILARRQRRIPLDRVQDVSTEAKLTHRLLGVVKLSVQTSSTADAEAELDCLSLADAERLQRALDEATSFKRRVEEKPHAEEQALIYRGQLRHIVLRGLTDNRAGLIVLSAFAVLERTLDLQDLPPVAALHHAARDRVGEVIASGTATLIVIGVFVALTVFLLGWVSSAVANAVRFYGFTVRRSEDVFYRRYGLFTQRVHALPIRRIQALRIEQTWLRRVVGIGTLRTDDMGSGAHERSAESAGVDVFIPAAPNEELFQLAPLILPGLEPRAFEYRRTSPTLIRRALVVGTTVGLVLGGIASWFVGAWAVAAVLVPISYAGFSALRYQLLGWDCRRGFLAVRDGVLSRQHAFAPLDKVQALLYVQNPFDRRWRVGKLVAVVGGGTTVVVPNLPELDARALLGENPFARRAEGVEPTLQPA